MQAGPQRPGGIATIRQSRRADRVWPPGDRPAGGSQHKAERSEDVTPRGLDRDGDLGDALMLERRRNATPSALPMIMTMTAPNGVMTTASDDRSDLIDLHPGEVKRKRDVLGRTPRRDQVGDWSAKPIRSRPESLGSPSSSRRSPDLPREPARRRNVQRAKRCINVDLPEPDGHHRRADAARSTLLSRRPAPGREHRAHQPVEVTPRLRSPAVGVAGSRSTRLRRPVESEP